MPKTNFADNNLIEVYAEIGSSEHSTSVRKRSLLEKMHWLYG
jgi:hypothetical protein